VDVIHCWGFDVQKRWIEMRKSVRLLAILLDLSVVFCTRRVFVYC